MNVKLIGAVFIIFGCSVFGFSLCYGWKREEESLRQLISKLDFMQCELQYRLTPLPDLCRQVSDESKDKLSIFFVNLADELESKLLPDVSDCVKSAMGKVPELPKRTARALELLGSSLGRFDIEGQIRGLEGVRTYCRGELESMAANREGKLRCYQTLGVCGGAALAILLV